MRAQRLVVAVLLLAPFAAAQGAQQILKDWKQQARDVLSAHKQGLAAAAAEIDDAIDDFQASFADLAASESPAYALVAKLAAAQASLDALQFSTQLELCTLAADALLLLGPAGPDDDIHPAGLLCGAGGTLDDTLAAMHRNRARTCAAANKRLTKVARQLRTQTDIRLQVTLWPPVEQSMAPLDGIASLSSQHELSIDLVATFNRGGVNDDGQLWLGGRANEGGVTWTVVGRQRFVLQSTTPVDGNHRWFVACSALGTAPESNYLVAAEQGPGSRASASVGMP